MSHRQLLAKRIGLVALTSLLVELNSLIMLPLLTKNLPTSEYGIWVMVSVTIGLIPAVALLGLPYTMVRFLPSAKSKEEIRQIVYSIAIVIFAAGFLCSAAIFILAEPIASALFDHRSNIVRLLSLLVFVECLSSIPFSYFRSMQKIKKYSIFSFSRVFLGLLLVIYIVLSGWGIIGAVIGLLIAYTMIFLIMGLFVVSDLGVSFPTFKNLREYLSFGLPTLPGNLSNWIINSSNRYVIGLLMGTTYVAYFSPGYTLGNMISLFIAPISFILPAALCKHYDENDIAEVKEILRLSLKYFLALGIPAAFGLSILSRPLLIVLSTPEIADHGYLITPFIALSLLFLGIYSIIGQVIFLGKRTAFMAKIWIMAAIINLALNFLLIPYWGIFGAAIGTLVAFAFLLIMTIYYADKFMKIRFSLSFAIKSLLSSLAMSIFLWFLRPEGSLELLLAVVSGALFYFVFLFFLKGFTVAEIDFFKKIFS